jgi:hypothetical protein
MSTVLDTTRTERLQSKRLESSTALPIADAHRGIVDVFRNGDGVDYAAFGRSMRSWPTAATPIDHWSWLSIR